MKKIKYLVAIILLLGISISIWWFEYYHIPPVSFVEKEDTEVLLPEFVSSYQSVDLVKNSLVDGHFIVIDKISKSENNQNRPPFNVRTLIVEEFSLLDQIGKLEVDFFNDRAMAVRFVSTSAEIFLKKFEQSANIVIPEYSDRAQLSSHVQVWTNTGMDNKKIINWVDTRLLKQYLLWQKRYGT